MNSLDEEESFIDNNEDDCLIISKDSENIVEHTLSAIRTSYNQNKDLHNKSSVFEENEFTFCGWFKRPNINVLFTLVAFKVLAENMVLSIILDQTLQKISFLMKNKDPIEIQREYTLFQSYTSIIQSLSGFIMCSYYANLSDMNGRVYVLKICGWWTLLGSIANIYLYCFDTVEYKRWTYILLYCVEGINGGVLSLTAIGSSYIFDISSKTQRFLKLSIFMSIIYGAIGVGPLLGSFLISKNLLNNSGMIYMAFVVNGFYSLGCNLLLKESRKERDRRESQTTYILQQQERKLKKKNLSVWKRLLHSLNYSEDVIDLFKPLKTLWVPKTHKGSLIPRYNVLILIFIEVFVNGFIEGCVPSVIAFSMFQFDWSSVEIGWFYSLSGIVRCIVLLIVVPKMLQFLQKKIKILNDSIDRIDKTYLNFFLLFSVLGFLSIIILPSAVGVYFNALFLSLTAFAIPTIQNVIIKYTSKKNTSVVFAGIAILRNLVQLVTPPILLKIYSMTLLNQPLTFLYIPLFFSIFSVFLLKFVRIIEDQDLLRRESVAILEENSAERTDDAENQSQMFYGSLPETLQQKVDISVIPNTNANTQTIQINSTSMGSISQSFNQKRTEMYHKLSMNEENFSPRSQSLLSTISMDVIDKTK
ncbi:hypothetical protein QEN19_000219 [Hanseniaspora menglaensis]